MKNTECTLKTHETDMIQSMRKTKILNIQMSSPGVVKTHWQAHIAKLVLLASLQTRNFRSLQKILGLEQLQRETRKLLGTLV